VSNARDAILARIRRSLHRTGPLEADVAAALDARSDAHMPHVQPRVGADTVAAFTRRLEGAGAQVTRLSGIDEIPKTVARHLDAHGLPRRLLASDDALLRRIPWPAGFAVARRAAGGDDPVSVTGAFAGAAETGTLALLSGPESPTTLNFLVEDHIVVVARERIFPHMEDIWARLRAEVGAVPRTVNLISGPSKTADVEQTLQIGAHGPRRLHVLIVGDVRSARKAKKRRAAKKRSAAAST